MGDIYERCFACRGAGVELGMEGDVATCSTCKGACVLRRRDSQGRFTSSDNAATTPGGPAEGDGS